MSSTRYEAEQDWLAVKAMLLDIHDNVVAIVQRNCIGLLVILDRYDKAIILRDSVLAPLETGDYHRALNNVQDFVLVDEVMYKLLPELIDQAEPGLSLLNELADEYELRQIPK